MYGLMMANSAASKSSAVVMQEEAPIEEAPVKDLGPVDIRRLRNVEFEVYMPVN